MATHGAAPATQPNQKGCIVSAAAPGGFADSWSQPNRIIATLAPTMPMSAEMSVDARCRARSARTMIVALNEYSTHRNRLMPAAQVALVGAAAAPSR